MTSGDYFARRAKILTDRLFNRIEKEYVKALNELYSDAKHCCETEIRAFYQRLADGNGISFAEAQKLLNSDELSELKWTLGEYVKYGRLNSATGGLYEKQLKNASAKWHISRLEALKMQLRTNVADKTADSLTATVTDAVKLAYSEAYYRNAFEIQKGIGTGVTMSGIDMHRTEKLLVKPWTADGKTFSARIWRDRTQLVDTIEKELTRMVATGEAPDRAIKAISDRLKVSKANAGRLVMTESAYFASEAQKDCFKELGVEKYRVVAALDGNTCPVCGAMDGKVFDLDDYRPGSTAEPFHPRCRCCTAPFFEDMKGVGTRIARDVKTGEKFELPADTTYEQWKELQDGKYGKGTVDIERKEVYNEKADRKQFERFKALLGDKAPKSFEAFQQVKYGDGYTALKVQYADARIQDRIKTGKLNTTVQAGKQGKHLKGHNNFIEGRSYLTGNMDDAQKLIKKYAGKGEIRRDSKGKWTHKEFCTADKIIGCYVSPDGSDPIPTNRFCISYATGKDKGVHIVPAKPEKEK